LSDGRDGAERQRRRSNDSRQTPLRGHPPVPTAGRSHPEFSCVSSIIVGAPPRDRIEGFPLSVPAAVKRYAGGKHQLRAPTGFL
jgi:hypothetical protein